MTWWQDIEMGFGIVVVAACLAGAIWAQCSGGNRFEACCFRPRDQRDVGSNKHQRPREKGAKTAKSHPEKVTEKATH